jgi:tetratricopeptide (TPR) repeat protein
VSTFAAEQAFKNGDLEAAQSMCEEVLAQSPHDAAALRIKGMIEVHRRHLAEAISYFRRALESAPKDFLTLEWLQGALLESGQYTQGLEVGEQALALRPNDVNILLGLSQACFKSGDFNRAIRYLEQARSLNPEGPIIRHLLGLSYEKAKRHREALAQFREAIRLKPTLTEPYDRVVRLLHEEGKFAAALKLCEGAMAAMPSYGRAYLMAAQALAPLGRREEAISQGLKAVELDPVLAPSVANWLQSYGQSSAALSILEQSIKDRPQQGRAYYGLVKARKMVQEDKPFLADLEQRLQGELLPVERLALLRALGKAADDLGEYELAMNRFDEAAALGKQVFKAEEAFDPARLEAATTSLLRFTDKKFFERHQHVGRVGTKPIFVIGMIRSGTTLIQQILTSHPEVGDAGELPFWTTAYPSIIDLDKQALREKEFTEVRDQYLEVVRRFDAGSPFVSNKWPMNYGFAALLWLAYPDAKIVHIRRNPVDTALSIYMSDLGEPQPEFSYEKSHIVAVYRDYERRMRHWETILPKENLLNIRYEDLVADQENWTRKLIEFCGLPWNQNCLEFYAGDRLVNTPSMLQVRRPIYKTSVEKWRNYELWLGVFSELNHP